MMYSITFGKLNGESVSFDKVTEIRTADFISKLKPISENEILNYAFNTKYVYQLIGENFNVIFYREADYISIQKTSN